MKNRNYSAATVVTVKVLNSYKNQRKVSENLVFHVGNFYNKRRIV